MNRKDTKMYACPKILDCPCGREFRSSGSLGRHAQLCAVWKETGETKRRQEARAAAEAAERLERQRKREQQNEEKQEEEGKIVLREMSHREFDDLLKKARRFAALAAKKPRTE